MKIEILFWRVRSVNPSLFLSIGFWYKKWFIPRRLVFCPTKNLTPRSVFTSPQEDEKQIETSDEEDVLDDVEETEEEYDEEEYDEDESEEEEEDVEESELELS